jgi:rhodanese-related sulfurtransferase
MDTAMTSSYLISPSDLQALLASATAPVLLDVRRDAAFDASTHMLAGAQPYAPQNIELWAASQHAQREQTIVVYCVYGHNVSAEACRQLRALGFQAFALAGGIEGGEEGVDSAQDISTWRASALPRKDKAPLAAAGQAQQ